MRADLQNILGLATGGPVASVSIGKLPGDKQVVLAWLYMKQFAPNINFNIPTLWGKAQGMQGVTPDNMIDFQIEGLATYLGYGNYTWDSLVAVARGAIDGPAVQQGGLSKSLDTGDYNDLINYALLTATKVLNDAS